MGNQLQEAYGASPITITMEVTAIGAPATIHVENKDGDTAPTDPCDSPVIVGPCPLPVAITAVGDTFTVFPAIGEDDLTNETFFFSGATLIPFSNRGGPDLHTSCSQPLIGETGSLGPITLKVIGQMGGSGSNCPEDVVGGHGGPIDKTALMVTGAQLNASWMIPVLISAIGIGVFVVTRK